MQDEEINTGSSEASSHEDKVKLEKGKDGVYAPSKSHKSISKKTNREILETAENEIVKGFRKGMKLVKAIGEFLESEENIK